MTLRVIERRGCSIESGAPVWLVECPDCRERYQLTAAKNHIAKVRSCQSCSEHNRRVLRPAWNWVRKCAAEPQRDTL